MHSIPQQGVRESDGQLRAGGGTEQSPFMAWVLPRFTCRSPVLAYKSPAGLLLSSSFMNARKDLNSRFSLSAFTLSSRAVSFLQASEIVHKAPTHMTGIPLQDRCEAC